MINNFEVNWLMTKIAHGVFHDCLDVFFQPYIDIVDSQCIGAEILIRGVCNNQIITPDKFISLCEENGTISEIDLFSFRSGMKFIRDNHFLQQGRFRFSFNFSPCSFNRPGFAAMLCEEVCKDEASGIILEITESNIPLTNHASRNAIKLREHGFLIAWDDVDSLNYAFRTLQYFKFDFAKLDKSLLANNKSSLMKNIITVYHDFNTEIIVEGVETETQLSMLHQLNVKYAQGFYFSPPVSKTEFIERIFRNAGWKQV